MNTSNVALVFANGQSCSVKLTKKILTIRPTVVVLDAAINRLPKFIQPEYLIGDFDREINQESLSSEYPGLTIIHTPDQNKTDFEKAIEWLIGAGYISIIILWGTGKRADHSLANLVKIMKFKTQVHLFLLDDYSIIYPLKSTFKKYFKKNNIISLLPMPKAIGVTSQGLLYELHQMTLDITGVIGNSNAAKQDGEVSITYQEGNLLLMESRDEPDSDWVFKSFAESLGAVSAQQ